MELISKIKNKLKNVSIIKLIFSIIFSVAIFLMNKIVFLGYVSDNNYIEEIFLNEFIWIIVLIPIFYGILSLIEIFYNSVSTNFISSEEIKDKRKICIVSFITFFLVFLGYYLSFFPGGIYIDTWTSLNMLKGEYEFTNHQPVFYTLLLNIVKWCLPNLQLGFGIIGFLQIVFTALVFTYFIYWLLKRKVNKIFIIFIVLFLSLFKLYPLYSVSIWKDTPFSLCLFLYSLFVFDVVDEIKNKSISIKSLIKCNILATLVFLLRSNGKYIIISTLFILLVSCIKKLKTIKNIKKFFIISIVVFAVCICIEKSYSLFGIKSTPFVENLAIPLQQISRVVAVDGNITEKQSERLSKFMPVEKIKIKYKATIVDNIKWDPEFNTEYLENNKMEFFKLWFELLLKNPGEYCYAFLLETCGFWTLNVRGEEAYVSPVMWESLTGEIKNEDVIFKYTNFSFKQNMLSYGIYSGGLFFWIMVLSITISLRKKARAIDLVGYVPMIVLWLTVMISTPMAQALRYVYALVLLVPLNIIYPKIIENKLIERENNEGEN